VSGAAWGYVAAVDLTTNKVIWKHRNGTVRDSPRLPLPLPIPLSMGVPSMGGAVSTAGGVSFFAGTLDQYLRAYDISNGKQLWQSRLPAGGQATPMTYTGSDGRQYVLIVAGGDGTLGTRQGDYVMAFALPKAP
jgi:quinoprotein glucose dehydrogenase